MIAKVIQALRHARNSHNLRKQWRVSIRLLLSSLAWSFYGMTAWGALDAGQGAIAPKLKAPSEKLASLQLGRLLTTAQQRDQIDRLRKPQMSSSASTATTAVEPQMWQINGVMQRPNRPAVVWIDGKSYEEKNLPKGLTLVRNRQGDIIAVRAAASGGSARISKIGEELTSVQANEPKESSQNASPKESEP